MASLISEATVPILSYNSQAIKELEKGCELTKMLREHLARVLKDGTNSQFVHIFEEISHTLALSRDILISTSNQNLLAATSQASIEGEGPIPKSKKRKTDEKSKVDCHQRRKYNSKRSEFTQMPDHDGYQWRKYGQKNILDKKYPRCYYRCTYYQDLNCKAAKQVQQCNDDVADQPLFEVTYFDEHTCNIATPKSKSKSTTNHNVIDFSGKSIPEYCLSADSMFAIGTRNKYNEDDAALVSCLTHVIKGSYRASSTETSENSNSTGTGNPLNTSNEYSSSISTNDDGTMEFMIPQDHEFPLFQPTTILDEDPAEWWGHDNAQFFSELWTPILHHF